MGNKKLIKEETLRMLSLVQYKKGRPISEQSLVDRLKGQPQPVIPRQDIVTPGGGPDSQLNLTPGKTQSKTTIVQTPITMGAGLFENGVDTIDKSSQEFKSGLNNLTNTLSKTELPINVTIVGGASRVGEERGYNNEALAKRRADNFLNAIKESLPSAKFNRITFSIKTKIGSSKIKNSPEARKEQFVQLTYPVGIPVTQSEFITARDATSTGLNRGYDVERPKTDTAPGNPYMIVKIYYPSGNKNDFKKKIFDVTGSPARELKDYSQASGLKFE